MKLTYYSSTPSNFGDALNPYIWARFLPEGFLDDNEEELFVGIGSILWDDYPKNAVKHVIGSGYGGYTGKPDLHDGSWNVLFVRGPRTASELQLAAETVVADAAILVSELELPPSPRNGGIAFMPHFESIDRGFWPEVCSAADIEFIDPRDPVEDILIKIRNSKLLISEAMHGIIVADALRTPWIPIQPLRYDHRAKWFDWAESMNISLEFSKLPPSGLCELYHVIRPKAPSWRGQRLNEWSAFAPINNALINRASSKLRALASKQPCLSRADILKSKCAEIIRRIDNFVNGHVKVTRS
jgi:succinoglycan biosynthesis protein ExoV